MNSPKIEVMPDDYEEEKKPVQEKKVEEKFEDKIEEKQEDVFQKMEDLDIKSEELSEEEKQVLWHFFLFIQTKFSLFWKDSFETSFISQRKRKCCFQ